MCGRALLYRLICGAAVLMFGPAGVEPASAAPPGLSSRTILHHARPATGWRHRRYPVPGAYPHFAWGPPWGSFSLFIGPGVGSLSFGTSARAYPWSRYAYPGFPYNTYDPYGIYYNPDTGQSEYWLPPVYMPPEIAYGPSAIQRFMGLPPAVAASRATRPAAPDAATIRDRVRKSNRVTRDRAMRFVQFGDALFQKQRYHEAVQRYRSAIEAAPDVADAYYHQAYALLATNRLELAAKAFRIALQLDAGVVDRFRLGELYEHNLIAMDSHLENLARKALAEPGNADLLMLVGLFLHDRGQPDRAAKFLQKARQLAGPAADFLQPLIDDRAPDPPAEEVLAGVDT